jgi:hypothetical protein
VRIVFDHPLSQCQRGARVGFDVCATDDLPVIGDGLWQAGVLGCDVRLSALIDLRLAAAEGDDLGVVKPTLP